MRRLFSAVMVAAVAVALLPNVAKAWDVMYDGSLLPNDPSLGANAWFAYHGTSMCSSDGSVLRISDNPTVSPAAFLKSPSFPARSPVTVEARVRVASGEGVFLAAGETGFGTQLSLYSDHFQAWFGGMSPAPPPYTINLSVFRTIRIATNSQGQSYVWVDGLLVAQGDANTPQSGSVAFGAGGYSGYLGDSYWDYVAYSNAFLPIPEPSSLLALLAGLGGFGAMLRRRRG